MHLNTSQNIQNTQFIFTENIQNTHLGVYNQHNGYSELIFRIDTFQTDNLEKDLTENGYKVLSITKNPA